jgi:6-phosphogluconolactonase/glucosamine-6-phosphate isomerase/deaminase
MDNNKSYYYFMHQHLLIIFEKAENINIPDGTVSIEEIKQYCIDYEIKIKKSGGLDFQLLGIGRTGHVGLMSQGRTSILEPALLLWIILLVLMLRLILTVLQMFPK